MVTVAFYKGRARLFNIDHGVRIKRINWHPENWDLVTVPGDCGAAVEWFHLHRGLPYDVLGIAGFVLRLIGQSKRRWFCSEACAAALGFSAPWRFDPNTFYAALSFGAVQPPP